MSTLAWIILLILILPAIGLLVWVILAASLMRVPSGSLGTGHVQGQGHRPLPAPRPALRVRVPPGDHRGVPSVELAYRADGQGDDENVGFNRHLGDRRVSRGAFDRLEVSGPPLRATLGDRTEATIVITVRFQLTQENLRTVHERYGPNGVFGIVRDHQYARRAGRAGRTPTTASSSSSAPSGRPASERLATAVRDALESDGIKMTGFVLGAVDLGRDRGGHPGHRAGPLRTGA